MRALSGQGATRIKFTTALFLTGSVGSASVTAVVARAVGSGWTANEVALYFGCVGVAGLVILNWGLPRLPAQLPLYWQVVGSQVILAGGLVGMCFSKAFLPVALIGLATQGFYVVANVRILSSRAVARSRSMLLSRGGYAAGWLVGPPLGGLVADRLGGDPSLLAIALALVVVAILLIPLLRTSLTATSQPDSRETDGARASARPRTPTSLIMLVTAVALMSVGGPMRASLLPVYVLDGLGESPTFLGLVMGAPAGLELILFLVVGRWLRSHWRLRLLVICGSFSPLYFGALALSPSRVALIPLQGLFAAYVVGATGVAVLVAQTWHGYAETATVAASTAETAGNLAGSALAVAAASFLPVPKTFVAPAVLALAGLALLCAAVNRFQRTQSTSGELR